MAMPADKAAHVSKKDVLPAEAAKWRGAFSINLVRIVSTEFNFINFKRSLSLPFADCGVEPITRLKDCLALTVRPLDRGGRRRVIRSSYSIRRAHQFANRGTRIDSRPPRLSAQGWSCEPSGKAASRTSFCRLRYLSR
jgi:hypothetical protein